MQTAAESRRDVQQKPNSGETDWGAGEGDSGERGGSASAEDAAEARGAECCPDSQRLWSLRSRVKDSLSSEQIFRTKEREYRAAIAKFFSTEECLAVVRIMRDWADRREQHAHRIVVVPALAIEDVIRWAMFTESRHVGREVAELERARIYLARASSKAIQEKR